MKKESRDKCDKWKEHQLQRYYDGKHRMHSRYQGQRRDQLEIKGLHGQKQGWKGRLRTDHAAPGNH